MLRHAIRRVRCAQVSRPRGFRGQDGDRLWIGQQKLWRSVSTLSLNAHWPRPRGMNPMHVSMSLRTALFSGTAFATMALASPAAARPAADGTAATAQPAASAQPAAAPASDAQQGQDIVVTGTHVVRDGYRSPTPLTVLTREDIQNSSPSNNIADFVNELPSAAGSTRPSNSRLNLSSGQAGINAINLRNLGEVRTLVLMDGRRSVASTINGLVDVNTIPQSLIERVDVVTGGASAAYGSDAVAGV